jgi:hypothetical protein
MRGLPAIGAVLTCALALGACGGSDTEAVVEAPTTATTAPPPSTTAVPAAREGCVPGLLAAAARDAYPGATVTDQVCSSTFAIATVDGETTGPVIGYFQIGEDGRWALVTTGGLEGDQFEDRPEGLPDTLVTSWRQAYTARVTAEGRAGAGP